MGTKVERNRMNVAVADVRKCTKILVEREWINTRSRMVAYDRVGSQVGASGAWIRRFVNGYEGAGLSWIVGQNIIAMYDQACSRVENNNENIRRDIAHETNTGIAYQRLASPEAGVDSNSLLPLNEYQEE